jgi:sugar/nucleoside kinase (ribokinase family)
MNPRPLRAARARRNRPGPAVLVIGNVNVDIIMGPLVPWPRPGTETILPQSELRVGGAVGNTALALQALGGRYRMICNIGDDVFGRWLSDAFGDAARGWPKARVNTTVSVGLTHPGGERTFLTTQGHLLAMTLADALGLLPARAGKGDVALLCGGFLSPRLIGSYEALISALVARGFALALDTGWPSGGWSPATRRRVAGWLAACDHILLNEVESCSLAGKRDVAAAALWISARAKPAATVVVKRGPLGASAWQDGESCDVAAPRVKVVDTIGAGDVFNAGYLHARLQGESLASAVRKGVSIASAAISTSPRRYGPAPRRARHAGAP